MKAGAVSSRGKSSLESDGCRPFVEYLYSGRLRGGGLRPSSSPGPTSSSSSKNSQKRPYMSRGVFWKIATVSERQLTTL
jgi:hypothetical protein